MKSRRIELRENEDSKNEEENEEEDNQDKQYIIKSQENKLTEKYYLDGIEVSAFYFENQENMVIIFQKDISSPRIILHWGIYKDIPIKQWFHPPKENYPRETREFDGSALDTEFINEERESKIEIEIPKNEGLGISFVFHNPNSNQWYNNNSNDFQIKFNPEI